jgi:hypothetical protein
MSRIDPNQCPQCGGVREHGRTCPTRTIFDGIKAADVKAMREANGLGLMECRKIAFDNAASQAVRDLAKEGVIDHRLKQVLIYLLDR